MKISMILILAAAHLCKKKAILSLPLTASMQYNSLNSTLLSTQTFVTAQVEFSDISIFSDYLWVTL